MQFLRAQARTERSWGGVDVFSEGEVELNAIGGARRCGKCFVTGLDELANLVSAVCTIF